MKNRFFPPPASSRFQSGCIAHMLTIWAASPDEIIEALALAKVQFFIQDMYIVSNSFKLD